LRRSIKILAEERKNTFRRKSNQLRRSIKILAEERKNTFRRKSNQLRRSIKILDQGEEKHVSKEKQSVEERGKHVLRGNMI
jgi:hypothetical protein